MDRLRLWLLPVYALVAFLGVVALMPKTSWILRSQLAESTRLHSEQNADPFDVLPLSYQLGPDASDIPTDDDSRFIQLMDTTRHALTDAGNRVQLRASKLAGFFTYCKAKNSAQYWAQYVRVSYGESRIPDNPSHPDAPSPSQWLPSRRMMVEACDEGKRLDAGNGFFPIMEAGTLFNMGNVGGARANLKLASLSTKIDEYVSLEIDARYQWFLRRFGFRGNEAKTFIMASILFPHFAEMKGMCRNLALDGKPEDRVATVRLGALLMRRSTTLIGMLVGRSIVSIGLEPPPTGESPQPIPDDQVTPLVFKLESEASGSQDLAEIPPIYKALKPPFERITDVGPMLAARDTRSALGSTALLVLLLFPLGLVGLWMKSLREKVLAASPHLVWIAALATTEGNETSGIAVAFSLAALLFIPALLERYRRPSDVIGLVLATVAIGYCIVTQSYGLLAGAIPYVCALAVTRLFRRYPTAVTITLFVLVLGFVVWITAAELPYRSSGRTGLMCLASLIAGIALVPVSPPLRWKPIIGIGSAAALIAFATFVWAALRADSILGKSNQMWLNEAQTIRDSLGIR